MKYFVTPTYKEVLKKLNDIKEPFTAMDLAEKFNSENAQFLSNYIKRMLDNKIIEFVGFSYVKTPKGLKRRRVFKAL